MSAPAERSRPESLILGDPSLAEWIAELADRLAAGEAVDLDAYARAHPERAEALRRYLPAIEMMAALGRSVARGEALPPRGSLVAELGTLGDFRLIREAGRGGMGVVYEAEQLSLRRRVALKILPLAAALDPRQLQRFQVEAQAAALLHHAHIVPVYAVGSERGVPYYAMQFIEGQTLADIIGGLRREAGSHRPGRPVVSRVLMTTQTAAAASGPDGAAGDAADFSLQADAPGDPCEEAPAAPPTQPSGSSGARSHLARAHVRSAVTLALHAAEALDHAHENGVIHRDIKPANLMVDGRGHLWITDFGLARLHTAGELTAPGDLVGTLRYMSPEQARGRGPVVDHRTDIYSLGVTLYELLTLTPAICGGSRQEILRGIESAEPRPPRRLNPAVPVDLETVVLKAMAKEPERRYATALELADDLRRVLEDRPVRARPPSLPERLERWGRRHRSAVAAGALALVLAVTGLGVGLAVVARERDESRRQALRAEEQFGRVLDVVDRLLTRVSEERLMNEPGLQPLRRDLLRTALAYLRQLDADRGADPRIRAPLAASLRRVAVISQRFGETEEALATARDSVRIYTELAHDHRDVPAYRAGLARADLILASVLRQRGDLVGAERLVRQAIEAGRKLVDADGGALDHQLVLTEGYENLSQLARDLGDTATARSAGEEAVVICRRLAEVHPGVPDLPTRLASAHVNLGLVQLEEGDHAGADRSLAAAVGYYGRLVEAHPRVPDYRSGLASACLQLGRLRCETDPADAAGLVQRAVDLWDALAREDPRVIAYSDRLARAYSGLADVHRAARSSEAALRAYEASATIQEGLVREHPGQASFWVRLGGTYAEMGMLLLSLGRGPESAARFRESIGAYRRGLEQVPGDPEISNYLAELLVNCPVPGLRAPREAVELSRRAAEQMPKAGIFWRTLGVASYHAGHYREAAEALERAAALRPGADAEAGLILALAYGRLGRLDPARTWLDRAQKWIAEGGLRGDRIDALHREAAALVRPGP